jgi:O-antigen/teichoic acid export membrane protein
MSRLANLAKGSSLTARAARSALFTVGGFGASQAIRLASNLILTRLLFPEAFGLMALVMVVLMGLTQFSDVGIGPSILQSKRGDDPEFLNTAWTIQIFRGAGLWLAACALAWPFAWVYGAPELARLLPVAALTLLIAGFNPTRLQSAQRHLQLGRITALDLVAQLVSITSLVLLAWWLHSVWALVLGNVISQAATLLLYDAFLPGARNRPQWEARAARELIQFGKWVFLATVCGFLYAQGDKMLIGKYLELGPFGIYNIGFFLASFPMLLGGMVTQKILIPIYRERPPRESAQNYRQLRKMRFALTGALMALLVTFSAAGVWLVELLYDPRYHAAGAVVVLLALMQIPHIIVLSYDQAALAAGDSRRFFLLTLAKAGLMIAGLTIGLETAGLIGALIGQGAAMLAVYPVAVWLARRMGAWDPLHDAVFALTGLALGALSLWLNWPDVTALAVGIGG